MKEKWTSRRVFSKFSKFHAFFIFKLRNALSLASFHFSSHLECRGSECCGSARERLRSLEQSRAKSGLITFQAPQRERSHAILGEHEDILWTTVVLWNMSKPILSAAVAEFCIGQKLGYKCQHMRWNLSEPAANRPVSTQRAVWNHRTCRDSRWKALSRVNSWDVLHFLVWFSFAWIQVSETERWWCSFHRILILFMFHWTCLCTTEPIHCMLGQNVDKKCFKSFWWEKYDN